jgi:hypothetical protein
MGSDVKEFLQTAEARTQEDLIAAISRALERASARDARNWFASCGYSIIQTALA